MAPAENNVPWVFILFFHVIVGPLLLFVLTCITYSFPDIVEGLLGMLGLIMVIVPVAVAMLFGFIPFTLLGIITGLLLRSSVKFDWAIVIIAGAGAFSGYIWPKLFENAPPGESTLSLILPTLITAVLCYYKCFLYQQKRLGKQ